MKNRSRSAAAWLAALLLWAPAPLYAGARNLEGYSLDLPAGWTLTRGAASDGQVGYIIEPPTVADGEESFVLFERTMAPGGAETTARVLQQEMLATGRPARPVERVRSFEVAGHPGARAELVGADPYGGEPARVIFWVLSRDFQSAVVFRAILLETRLAAFASTLEGLVRSILFAGPYVPPVRPIAPADGGPTGAYDPRTDAWSGQGEQGYTLDGSYPGQGEGAVESHVSEVPLSGLAPEPGRAIGAAELRGNYCGRGDAAAGRALQFDGKGQWARHPGAPPEEFSLKGLPPDDSGFYRVAGTVISLDSHTGKQLRCSSPSDGVLSCQGGLRYERPACDLEGWNGE